MHNVKYDHQESTPLAVKKSAIPASLLRLIKFRIFTFSKEINWAVQFQFRKNIVLEPLGTELSF